MLSKFKLQQLSLLKSRSGLRAIITNTGWLFADRILRMGVGLIVGVWVARYLGVHQYGLFNYATAFVALFSSFATLGLDNVVVRDIVHDVSHKEKILGTSFWLKLFGGVSCLLLAVSTIYVLRHDDKMTIWLVAILGTAGIFQAFDTIDFWFQSQVQSKYTVVAKNTAFIITTLIKIALIQMQASLIAFAWMTVVEIGLGAMGLAIAYNIKGYSFRLWRWSFPVAKTLLKDSWPLILSGLTIMIYMRIDQIMLGEIIGDGAVGIYSAASRISEVWYFIPTAIVSSVSPTIFAAKQNNEEVYYQRIKQLLGLMVLISIAIALPMSFLSGSIITMLFGNDYAPAAGILSIHIWASLFVFIGVGTSPWFIAEGLTHLSLRRTLVGAIINVVLNLFLIPTYAGVGAAIATVISYAFGSFLVNAMHPKTQKIFNIQIKSIFILK
ncbi:MAG: flippase [Nostoc sp. ZfuVER08]|jgi:PST family polysaccharide transporter|uniref:Flippase n=1 Tax=Nostoc punctiforme FACHB-252 TaxID=1357509 RepID=A0ABR8H8B1_NOSPU|nr:flippase [Nostoc punctiforme]MBD2611988.1 flippase [Nostoc punctiforme FACHB-252]MBL1202197.1 flippase [Nostoc sp. GBBB01]MDZ8010572.1 flippase [Nostoc sp. ZfuVER08]